MGAILFLGRLVFGSFNGGSLKSTASSKLFDATGVIYNTLLTSKERVAGAAKLDIDLFFNGANFVSGTASAGDRSVREIVGVDISFHKRYFGRYYTRALAICQTFIVYYSYSMKTPVTLFDYSLPEEFIAQTSVWPRDQAKMLVLGRQTGTISHDIVANLTNYLSPGDVLVFNVSKVFKARILVGKIEIFVLKILTGQIECLLRPGRKISPGQTFAQAFGQYLSPDAFCRNWRLIEKTDDGIFTVDTGLSATEMLALTEQIGQIPTPPYVQTQTVDDSSYQTVYAKTVGSVAAPTAGLHFTPELLESLRQHGVQIEEVTLHVGIGTFRPVQTDFIEDHPMHAEWVDLDTATVDRLKIAKQEGRRIIAVGTTATRVLEGIAQEFDGELAPFTGELNLFISPGFKFKVIDGLLTNFHLPKSTLLMLVSAFAGRESILNAYEVAKLNNYRFFSFGDAMLIL